MINSPRHKNQRIKYTNNLYGIKLNQLEYTHNKPTQVAATILDLSKLIMFDSYYKIKLKFDTLESSLNEQKCRLVYTDTDSLVIWFKLNNNQNIYRDFIIPNKEFFDLSSYPSKHEIWDGMLNEEKKLLMKYNEKIVGKFKDEMGGTKQV